MDIPLTVTEAIDAVGGDFKTLIAMRTGKTLPDDGLPVELSKSGNVSLQIKRGQGWEYLLSGPDDDARAIKARIEKGEKGMFKGSRAKFVFAADRQKQ